MGDARKAWSTKGSDFEWLRKRCYYLGSALCSTNLRGLRDADVVEFDAFLSAALHP